MDYLTVRFELPVMLALQAGLDIDNISEEIKQMLAIYLYEHKRISLSKACEIGGISQWEFFEMNRQLRIPIYYTKDDSGSNGFCVCMILRKALNVFEGLI